MIDPQTIAKGIAFLAIIGQGATLLVLLGWPWRKTALRGIYQFLATNALLGAFLIAVFSTLGSLYISDVANYVPCELCWYQRIMMYPLVLLLGLAVAKKNRDIRPQLFFFAGLGLLIAIYHVYLQSGGTALVPCSTAALAVPCGVKNFQVFGYVTIPVMSLTGFAMLLVASVLSAKRESDMESK